MHTKRHSASDTSPVNLSSSSSFVFVEIVPIKRMPRGLDVFDYAIPDDFVDSILPGQLVTIPLRKSTVHGLVFSLPKKETESPTGSIKSVTSIVHKEPIISPLQLEQIRTMSAWYGVSFGTIAKMCLLPMQKRKLQSMSLSPLPKSIGEKEAPSKPMYHHYKNESEHKAVLENASEQTLILVPEVHLVDQTLALLPDELQKQAIGWHGSLSTKEQFARWLMIRNGEKRIVVATRAGVFLPLCALKTIIVDREHDENHKHADQAPRFHAKNVAEFLASSSGAALHFASHSPSVESYYHIHKEKYAPSKPFILEPADISVVDMADERRGKNFSLFSNKLEDALLDAAGDVFLFINRLGYATSVGCNDCGHTERCATCQSPLVFHKKTNQLHCHYCQTRQDIPLRCPSCGRAVVKLRGIGTEQVETLVRGLLGDRLRHTIQRIDSLSEPFTDQENGPKIIIGTEMAFRHIRWEKTELIAFLDIDKQLLVPEYTAGEHVWHRIHDAAYHKKDSSTFMIQTFNPSQLVIKSLAEPDRFYRTDLNHRRALGYPPYRYLVRYMTGRPNQKLAEKEAGALQKHLLSSLTNAPNRDILSHSIEMHPHYYRRAYWYMLLARLPMSDWQKTLPRLNQSIPARGWKIDPNPISILSP